MAELFLAEDSRTRKLVCIKRILPYLVTEPEFVQMFLDEARIVAQLHHPNVVEVNELGKLGDHIFIAMEYVDGIDLRRIFQQEQKRQGLVPYAVAAYLVARVCDGLYYAHNRVGLDGRKLELIHRDISPQNVMVSYEGDVKLVDFGIAKASAIVERSKPGVIKGKYLYLAPEQLTQEPLDHRADLFALGSMLYEVTTGKSPFAKLTTEAVILAIRNEEPSPPHLLRSDYPVELSRILMRCLQKDRNRRYQQASEIRDDLDAFARRTLAMDREGLRSYIARLFGTDEDRTVLNLPGRPDPEPPRPLPAPPTDEHAEVTASTQSERGSLRTRSAPELSSTVQRPTIEPYSDDEPEPKTMTARPEDIARAFGMSGALPVVPPPARRRSGDAYARAGEGTEDESTILPPPSERGRGPGATAGKPTPPPAANARPPPAAASPKAPNTRPPPPPAAGNTRPPPAAALQARIETPLFTPQGPSSAPSAHLAPALSAEPSTSRERRKASTSAPSTPPPRPPAPVEPLSDRDDDESTAGFKALPGGALGAASSRLAFLNTEKTAATLALGLLVAGLIAVSVLVYQRLGSAPASEEGVEQPAEESPSAQVDAPDDPPPGDPTATPQPPAAVEDAGARDPRQAQAPAADAGVATAALEPPPADDPPLPPAQKVPVIFKARAGTLIKVYGKSLVPGKQYRYAPGTLKYSYRCPKKGSSFQNRTERLARTQKTEYILLKCPR